MNNTELEAEQIDLIRSITPEEIQEKRNNDEIESDDKIDSLEDKLEAIDENETTDPPINKGKSPYKVRQITALGMMDVALLTANANQLRFLITYNAASPTYYVSLILVIVSLVLQICVGIALIFKRQMKDIGNNKLLDTTNNLLTAGIFLITVINVFIASFTITESPPNIL